FLVRIKPFWPVGLGLLSALIGILLYNAFFPTPTPITGEEIDDTIVAAIASATPPRAYSVQVYQIILPSLVYIQTQGNNPENEYGYGVGSGVIINEEGAILTSHHIVDGATAIKVMFADGTQADAQIISAEPENDIAVLHANRSPEVIVPAVMGSTSGLRIGDEAFAVGNPLALPSSMSAGVISGFDRSIKLDNSDKRLDGLIQFDAAVNPGNSGGPLLNRNGQVIGIVTGLVNPSDQNFFVGIGFAVPIGTASGVAGGPAQ
ncbi:MAG: trypsin-like peptidase domain-containing protein, partial [Chloroflexota bacterium]|nr:trypsin-like peptidase domain-containing protein [Chloroflexota bacterium]